MARRLRALETPIILTQMSAPNRLRGKIALVTSGSRGIGAAIVQRLASEGAHVALTYSRSPDRATEVVKAAEALGVKALSIQARPTFISGFTLNPHLEVSRNERRLSRVRQLEKTSADFSSSWSRIRA